MALKKPQTSLFLRLCAGFKEVINTTREEDGTPSNGAVAVVALLKTAGAIHEQAMRTLETDAEKAKWKRRMQMAIRLLAEEVEKGRDLTAEEVEKISGGDFKAMSEEGMQQAEACAPTDSDSIKRLLKELERKNTGMVH